MEKIQKLYTEDGQNIPDIPWNVYPRPQMKRDSFLCLNGKWAFESTESQNKPDNFSKQITVPFSPETLLSEVGQSFDDNTYLWYEREFALPEGFKKDRVFLHFGAVDNTTTVFVNGKQVGSHFGGYDPFYFDITDYLKEENTVTVRVQDIMQDRVYPYGKQCRKRGGMWYTPTSGIWQTVWLESVNESYIKSLSVETKDSLVIIKAENVDKGTVKLNFDNNVLEYRMQNGICTFEVENKKEWSPESPYLYYYTLETETDRVESYFAFRTLEIKNIDGYERLCLNGKPYFFHGVLDQGYWSDGGLTPPSPNSYEKDILAMKSLGFNMLRKHIKIEPMQFYYDCDRLGMVVFQDMINNGKYSFLRDTALPTIGFRHIKDTNFHKDKKTRQAFVASMEKTVEMLKSFSCICYWTIFNEGWGQFCGTEMYYKLKKLDKDRFIDTASGWFSDVQSDVSSKHVYFRKIKLEAGNKPLVLSEFGGYSYRIKEHSFNLEKEYGYGKYDNREDFVKALCDLYENEVVPLVKNGLTASVYTQLSDVEDETNGLLTFDRRVMKVKPDEFLPISEKLKI